uniref:RING-type E3 ubiquitin transferase n=2 Tax=Caenorhabditis tropicalis TaxID=1561998 RepID=A0A1I7UFL8_9PELO
MESLPKKITHFGPYDKKAIRVEKPKIRPVMNEYGCNVCNEEYSPRDPLKCPRVLTGCGHTICHSCAMTIAGRNYSIFCPFDRTSTPIPGGDVKSLKKNFALLELMERIGEEMSSEEKTDKFSKERLLNLECDENSEHVAVFFCTVCESNLCERCSESTHSTNVLSKHRRIPLTEKPAPVVHCRLHSSYVVEFVCKEVSCDTESPLMCLMCRDYGRHKGHYHVLIEKEVEDLREKLREHLGELTRQSEIVDGAVMNINSTIQELTPGEECGSLEETKQEVRNHFQRLRTAIERDEAAAVETIDRYARTRIESLQTQKERLEAFSRKIGSTCITLHQALIMEKAKILDRKDDLLALAESTAAEPTAVPDPSQLSTRIAFSFSNDRKLHIGDFIESRVVLLGLDGAGKTSIVRRLKKVRIEAAMAPLSTSGFNIETIHHKNYRLTFWDVGGLPKLRHLWKHYYWNAQAIFYVIDGHDVERFSEAIKELNKVMSDPLILTCPVFVAINRKDGSALNNNMDALLSQLESLPFQPHCHYCDAATGSGIDKIIDELTICLSRLNGTCPV